MNIRLPGKSELSEWAVILSAGIIVGLTTGWILWKPRVQPKETPAPAIIQGDGSVVIKRDPSLDAKPVHEIPKGSVVERVIHVEVQPSSSHVDPIATPGSTGTEHQVPLSLPPSPVRLDLTLVRLQDGTRRVVASSPDGTVIPGASVDIPVEPAKPEPKVLKWAAGAVYGGTVWGDKAVGVFLDRDVAFVRTGVELTRNTYAMSTRQGWEVRARVGIRF